MKANLPGITKEIYALKEILDKVVRPLLCGAELHGPFTDQFVASGPVTHDTEYRLKVRVAPSSSEYFLLQRLLSFALEEKDFTCEIIRRVHSENIVSQDDYLEKARTLAEKVIAMNMGHEHAETVFQVLKVYAQWSANSKEPISHTIGINLNRQKRAGDDFFSLKDEDFVKTLGSATDTLLALDANGKILGVENLAPASVARMAEKYILAPACWADVALWTNTRHRVAIHLTGNGKMAIFRYGKMALYKRDSVWRRPPHRLILEDILSKELDSRAKEVLKAVYLTALDMAFDSRKPTVGGILSTNIPAVLKKSIAADSLLTSESPGSIARLAADIINNRQFQSLPRSIRHQLCSFDGAMVLDLAGNILTVGASMGACKKHNKNYSESEAAKTLGLNGMGFCVFPKGGIEIYRANYPPLVLA